MSDEIAADSAPEPEKQSKPTAESSGRREPQTVDELPQWVQKKLHDLQDEDKGGRLKAREAEEKAARANEEVENLKKVIADQANTHKLELYKLRTALDLGIPGGSVHEFAARLIGSSEKEVQADAEKLASNWQRDSKPAPLVDQSAGRGSADHQPSRDDIWKAVFAGKKG